MGISLIDFVLLLLLIWCDLFWLFFDLISSGALYYLVFLLPSFKAGSVSNGNGERKRMGKSMDTLRNGQKGKLPRRNQSTNKKSNRFNPRVAVASMKNVEKHTPSRDARAANQRQSQQSKGNEHDFVSISTCFCFLFCVFRTRNRPDGRCDKRKTDPFNWIKSFQFNRKLLRYCNFSPLSSSNGLNRWLNEFELSRFIGFP